jgi:hypothetical protein
MRCLTDAELQTVVDHEATEAARAHAASCSGCRGRVEERRRRMAELAALMETEGSIPATAETRLRAAVTSGGVVRGATALRGSAPPSSWRPGAWLSAVATAAVVALIVFLVLPRFGAPTSLSAAQILGRSLQTMSAARGVELLEYELSIGGLSGGPHRIQHLIDREHPARYRFVNYGPDGLPESAISQDPFSARRSELIRVDGRNYIVRSPARDTLLSLPQMMQAQLEAMITLMQATADQKLTILESTAGRQYLIEIPPVTPKEGAGTFDLYQARALIDARDFRIREFAASGALLKQPYSVTFKLTRELLRQPAEVPPAEFEIPSGPGDVVLEGEGASDPFSDVLFTVLRELGRRREYQ